MSNCFKCKNIELRDDGLFECIDDDETYDPESEDELKLLLNVPCLRFDPKTEEPEKHNCKDCRFHKVVVAHGSYSRHEEVQCSHKEIGNPLDYTIENDCIFFEAPKPQDLPGRVIMDGKEIDPVFRFETIDGELKQTAGEPMVSEEPEKFGTMIPTEPGYYGVEFKGELETMEVFHRGISGDVYFIFNTVDTDDDVYDAQEIADDFINEGILKIGARIEEPEHSLNPVFCACSKCKEPASEFTAVGKSEFLCFKCAGEIKVEEPACPFCGHVGSHKPPVHHICNTCKCWFTPETTPKVEDPEPDSGHVEFTPGKFYTSPFTVGVKRDGESRYFVNGQPMRPDKEKPECPYCGKRLYDAVTSTRVQCGWCHKSTKVEVSYTTTGLEKDDYAAECIKPEMSLCDDPTGDAIRAGAPCPLCSCVEGEVEPCDATGEDRKPGAPCPVCSGEVPE